MLAFASEQNKSRFQPESSDLHWTTVKNILKYLRNTKDMFLVTSLLYENRLDNDQIKTRHCGVFMEPAYMEGSRRRLGSMHLGDKIVLSIEDKLNYLEQQLPPAPIAPASQQVAPEILAAHTVWVKGSKEIAGLMLK
ncbi:hypothetical protein Tco_1194474 [Tanacetum coccineum]